MIFTFLISSLDRKIVVASNANSEGRYVTFCPGWSRMMIFSVRCIGLSWWKIYRLGFILSGCRWLLRRCSYSCNMSAVSLPCLLLLIPSFRVVMCSSLVQGAPAFVTHGLLLSLSDVLFSKLVLESPTRCSLLPSLSTEVAGDGSRCYRPGWPCSRRFNKKLWSTSILQILLIVPLHGLDLMLNTPHLPS